MNLTLIKEICFLYLYYLTLNSVARVNFGVFHDFLTSFFFKQSKLDS